MTRYTKKYFPMFYYPQNPYSPAVHNDQLWSGTWLKAIVFHCNNFDYSHIKLDYTQNKFVQIHGNLINVLNVIIVKIIIFQWNEDMKLKIKKYVRFKL